MTGPASFAADQLKSFVERLERIQEDIDAANDDKRDIFAEAKAMGFDVKILKEVLKLRRVNPSEREEQEAILDLYMQALGMIFVPPEDDDNIRRAQDAAAVVSDRKKDMAALRDAANAAKAAKDKSTAASLVSDPTFQAKIQEGVAGMNRDLQKQGKGLSVSVEFNPDFSKPMAVKPARAPAPAREAIDDAVMDL